MFQLRIIDIRFLFSWWVSCDSFLHAVVRWKGLVETDMGALSDVPTPPRSWLWNKIKWHFRLETLPFSWLEFWLKIPRGSRCFLWESQFTVESGSHNFKFVNWFLMLINSLYKSWPDHCWCNISRTQLHGGRGRESEVRCLKNLCTRQCQQGKGAAAVFDVFSSNAKSCYESNMERTRAHDVDEPVLRLAYKTRQNLKLCCFSYEALIIEKQSGLINIKSGRPT